MYAVWLVSIIIAIILHGCVPMKYSPWQTDLPSEEKHQITENLNILRQRAAKTKGKVKVALLSDPQGTPHAFEKMISAVNRRDDIDFVAILGDFTNLGLKEEYLWANDQLKKLRHPYLPVIGNHDALSHGKKLYQDMFGAFDYTLDFHGYRFIFWNNNRYEFQGSAPDFGWLSQQIKQANKRPSVVLSHIPPVVDIYNEKEITEWKAFLSDHGVKASVHGHRHTFLNWEEDSVKYFVTTRVGKNGWGLMTLENGEATFEVCQPTCRGVKK